MTRPIIDISQPLTPEIATWPGDTAFAEQRSWSIGPGCPVNVSKITLSTHCGTHADAPLHYDGQGKAIGGLDLDAYLGRCRVIDARGDTPLVPPSVLDGKVDGLPPRVLLRLVEKSAVNHWPSGFRTLSAETVERLAALGVRLVGIDVPSLDPEDSKTMDAHRTALQADMRILENLVLDHVEPGDYELVALPIRLENLDAAPVRAVLRPLTV
ncbi:MAG: arylformamidase [Hyphomicrobiales bacterium]|nr:arylformamidase [Hyphomicrobiales bacterium]